ncbi:response regulator [Okibacterium fritillariae]|uniref:response regulator n=1 Tax=Okibacterium fritillariae TaxID=123320 RepID=UPI00405593A6
MSAASDDLVVLVVDDDFRVARLHAEYAARVPGVRVLEPVGTAAAARQAIAQHRPGLVLLDAYLPDESGLDLLRDIDADVFLLSAASDADTVRTALRRGALCYLIKPFAADALTDRIAAFQRFANVVPADPARTLDQEAIERGLRIVHSGDSPGGSRSRSATEQAVLDAVERADAELSAVDVAERVGVSRATAQRYLSGLAADGSIRVQLNYGSTGRPEHRYLPRG